VVRPDLTSFRRHADAGEQITALGIEVDHLHGAAAEPEPAIQLIEGC